MTRITGDTTQGSLRDRVRIWVNEGKDLKTIKNLPEISGSKPSTVEYYYYVFKRKIKSKEG